MARKTIDQLFALTIPEIQEVFLQTMQGIVDDAMLDQMIIAIENNDPEALFRASGFTPAALGPILDRVEQSYRDAGVSESSLWPKRIITPVGDVRFRFDIRNPVVEEDLRQYSSALVTRLTNEARENVRTTLQRGMVAGDNPRQTALNIVGRINPATGKRQGGVIGLTVAQEGWAANAKRYLEQADSRYFSLTLRDKRFDSVVKKAMADKQPLSKAQIDRLVTSYKTRALRYRGETIARTETLQSINKGAAASYAQAINEGTLSRDQVTKEWDDVGGPRVRHTHRTMGKKYGKGKGIGVDDVFVSLSGSRLKHPGDISLDADASEIVNCRCKAKYRVDWFRGLENG